MAHDPAMGGSAIGTGARFHRSLAHGLAASSSSPKVPPLLLAQSVALFFAARLNDTAQNLRVSAAIPICSHA